MDLQSGPPAAALKQSRGCRCNCGPEESMQSDRLAGRKDLNIREVMMAMSYRSDARVCLYPGEQNPDGAASPEEPQYLPGGQSSQADRLDKPICPLKAPAGHGNAAADCVSVDE